MVNVCRKIVLKRKKTCPLGLKISASKNLTKRNKLETRSVVLHAILYW